MDSPYEIVKINIDDNNSSENDDIVVEMGVNDLEAQENHNTNTCLEHSANTISGDLVETMDSHTPTILPNDLVEELTWDGIAVANRSRLLGVFFVIELLCSLKFILLPVAVVRLVGGPDYIIVPWSLWALIMFGCQSSLLVWRHANEPSAFASIFCCYRQLCRRISCTNINFQEDEKIDFVLRCTTAEVGYFCTLSSLDCIMSAISIAVGAIVISFVFMEPDGRVVLGWRYEYGLLIAEIFFCCVSMVSRLCLMIVCCMLSRTTLRFDHHVRSYESPIVQYKSCMILINIFFAIIAFGFVTNSLNDGLKSKYYHNDQTATYSICDPMVTRACALPFPSSYWLKSDPSTATGFAINMQQDTMPFVRSGYHINSDYLNEYDGFSVSSSILWHLPGMQYDQFVPFTDIAKSMMWNCSTLVIDLTWHQLQPHFTEADYLDDYDNDRIAYVQPARALEYNRHYVVVVKDLLASSGELLPASDIMHTYATSYLSQTVSPTVASDPRYALLSTVVFPLLQSHNISILSVQLCWDFRTASQISLLGDIQSIYNSTILRMESAMSSHSDKSAPLYTVMQSRYGTCSKFSATASAQGLDSNMAAEIYYSIDVPWYLESYREEFNYMRRELMGLSSSEVGRIPMGGSVGLLVQVPCSVYFGLKQPSVLLEYGHGIFANRADAESDFLHKEANQNGWVMWAMDWRGFAAADLPIAGRLLMHDSTRGIKMLKSCVLQGFASKLAARSLVRHILEHERLTLGIPAAVVDFSEAALPSRFMGDSMGGILGAGYTSWAGYKSAVLLVSGSPFTFLLSRSFLLRTYMPLIKMQFYNTVDFRIAITSWQLLLDQAESSGWAHSGRYDDMAVLVQVALGDSTVTTVASRILGLNLNATQVSPALFPVYGMQIQTTTNSTTTSTRKVLFEGIFPLDAASLPRDSHLPAAATNVHGCVPYQRPVQIQNSAFITNNGQVISACGDVTCVFDGHANCGN